MLNQFNTAIDLVIRGQGKVYFLSRFLKNEIKLLVTYSKQIPGLQKQLEQASEEREHDLKDLCQLQLNIIHIISTLMIESLRPLWEYVGPTHHMMISILVDPVEHDLNIIMSLFDVVFAHESEIERQQRMAQVIHQYEEKHMIKMIAHRILAKGTATANASTTEPAGSETEAVLPTEF